ncbi:MAG: tripartite tricarboxylate transporter substrate binding protein [Pseudomonadota bacterium]
MPSFFPKWAAALLLAGAAACGAQTAFPDRAITIYCAFPAGASADTALRALAQAASRQLGQPVIVDSRPGVGGTLGAAALMSTRPDGYTLAQVTNTLMRQPFIGKTPYDPHKDFSYVISPTAFEMGLVVRADSPWKTLGEFVAYAQQNPGKVTFATSGVGTIQHQVMQHIGELKKIDWVHAPYKGTAPALNDLQGGHIAAVSDTSAWAPFVDSGKFRLLAVYGPQRLKRWPAAPTLKEQGYDIAENVPWGLVAPTGTDPKVVKTLQDAFHKAMSDPGYIDTLALLGQEPRYMGSDEYQRYMRGRIDLERDVVEKYNLKQQ